MIDQFLVAKTIYLRPLKESDCEGNYPFWLNNQTVTQHNSHGKFPYTKAQAIKYVQSIQGSQKNIVLAIVDRDSNQHIGNVSLQAIDWQNQNAELAILIGESDFFKKGIGYEASKLMLNHAFNTLNLHRVYCGTSSGNIAMQKIALKLGMQKEGIRKEVIFKNGHYFDIIEYGILK